MSTTVEQIKNRLSITDVIGSYVTLEKSGSNLKARCPFHNEKTPSFFISPERNSYYCFGCGAKGDIFSFVEQFETLDFVGALKVLADRAGVPLEEFKKSDTEKNENARVFAANEEACIFFQNNLGKNKEALLYLKNRGLAIEMVRTWRVGFASAEWRELKDYLLKKGFSEREALTAGLSKESEKGSYDRFRGRIMFPIFDSSGRVIAFSGRILEEKKSIEGGISEPKYLNSPETPIFNKSKALYGLQKAKYAIREKGYAVLVEGQLDLLLSHQAGFANTVASSGTALSEGHVEILKRYADSLVIAYDSDDAGQNASLRAWQLALSAGLDVKVVLLGGGKDPADVIKENPDMWKTSLEKADHVVDYYLTVLKGKDEKEGEKITEETILPLICAIEGSSGKSKYVAKLSFATGIPEKNIWEDLAKVEVVSSEEAPKKEKKASSDSLKKALSLLFYLEKIDSKREKDFLEKFRKILPEADEKIKENEKEKDVLIFEAEACFGNAPNAEAEREVLYYLEEDTLKDRFTKAMYSLKIAEGKNDKEEIDKNTQILNGASKELTTLRNKYQKK